GAIVGNFDKLPDNVKNLLLKLADNDYAAGAVAGAIVGNFDKLPDNVRNELLLKLADKHSAAIAVGWATVYKFDKLPIDLGNELLSRLLLLIIQAPFAYFFSVFAFFLGTK